MSESNQPETDPRWRLTPTKIVVAAILLVGIVVPLLVSTYDRKDPELFGFPFFYWYQQPGSRGGNRRQRRFPPRSQE